MCGNTDGTTQMGWNIKWVDVASGAGGGSELADIGEWATSDPIVGDLVTTTARALYNHNTTRSKWFYMFAGAKGTVYSGILPGQDDEAVSYHSTGGVSGSSGGSLLQPGRLVLRRHLTPGTAACSDGRAKWSYHTVQLRDDGEAYNHYANGNWAASSARSARTSSPTRSSSPAWAPGYGSRRSSRPQRWSHPLADVVHLLGLGGEVGAVGPALEGAVLLAPARLVAPGRGARSPARTRR